VQRECCDLATYCRAVIIPFFACSLAADLVKAVREERELQNEIASIHAEMEAEKLVQAAAKERLAILLDVEQVSAASQ